MGSGYWAQKPVGGGSQGPKKRTPGHSWNPSARPSQEHCGLSPSEYKILAARCGAGMPGRLYSPLTVWPFICVQGRIKNGHVKVCILAVMISTQACGRHCSASPGRSLALTALAGSQQVSLQLCSGPGWLGLIIAAQLSPKMPGGDVSHSSSLIDDHFYFSFAVDFLFTAPSPSRLQPHDVLRFFSFRESQETKLQSA